MNVIKLAFLSLSLAGLTLTGYAQGPTQWVVRLGAVGTGTFDEGIWNFAPTSSMSSQVFTFQNSWGAALDISYAYGAHWSTGLHFAVSHTGFELDIDQGTRTLRDNTSFNPVLLEQSYHFRPEKRFRPLLGLTGGILFTQDIALDILDNVTTDFTFRNPFVYGFLFGAEVGVGKKGWALHAIIRALTFDYTMEETSLTQRQTLLDQVFWMNYNHIQLGIGKSF